jgi:hypothetical protein
MPEDCVAIIDAMGVTEAGVFGDILAQRMRVRGVAGLVTDGVMRDKAGVLETGLPVWCAGAAAPASVAELRPGAVDRAQLQTYAAAMGKAADPTLTAAAGPNLVSNSDELLAQTASAIWGEPGIIPRSHMGADGVWEFPRLPDQDEQDLLVGQRWRIVENEESQILFLGPDRRFGWDDFADLINPLQHIPLVNLAYRAMTGDQIYGAGRLMDLGFGPVAGASTVFELAYQSTTGRDLEYEAVAAVFGPAPDNETASLARDEHQVADLRDLRRGSNQ